MVVQRFLPMTNRPRGRPGRGDRCWDVVAPLSHYPRSRSLAIGRLRGSVAGGQEEIAAAGDAVGTDRAGRATPRREPSDSATWKCRSRMSSSRCAARWPEGIGSKSVGSSFPVIATGGHIRAATWQRARRWNSLVEVFRASKPASGCATASTRCTESRRTPTVRLSPSRP